MVLAWERGWVISHHSDTVRTETTNMLAMSLQAIGLVLACVPTCAEVNVPMLLQMQLEMSVATWYGS